MPEILEGWQRMLTQVHPDLGCPLRQPLRRDPRELLGAAVPSPATHQKKRSPDRHQP